MLERSTLKVLTYRDKINLKSDLNYCICCNRIFTEFQITSYDVCVSCCHLWPDLKNIFIKYLIYVAYKCLQAFSQHMVLSVLFLEHVISVLSQIPILKCDVDGVEDSQVHNHTEDGKLEAAIFALTAFFRSVLLT